MWLVQFWSGLVNSDPKNIVEGGFDDNGIECHGYMVRLFKSHCLALLSFATYKPLVACRHGLFNVPKICELNIVQLLVNIPTSDRKKVFDKQQKVFGPGYCPGELLQ